MLSLIRQMIIIYRFLDFIRFPQQSRRDAGTVRPCRRCADMGSAACQETQMRRAQVIILATLLATAGLSVQAAELRLDDAELDSVSAGLRLPRSPLLQQLPAIMEANGFTQALRAVDFGPALHQLGGLGGLLAGLRLPIGYPGDN
jgi:hypothetical protein